MNSTYLIAAAALALLAACSGRDAAIGNSPRAAESVKSEPAATPVLSALQMADPAAAPQLVSGFHDIEQSAWRWTERRFSVLLKRPDRSDTAQLTFRFAIPAVVIEKLKSMTLTASTNGAVIGSESYTAAGEYLFSKPLPVEAKIDPVQIDFELDRAIPAGELETRELGVIAVSVGLE